MPDAEHEHVGDQRLHQVGQRNGSQTDVYSLINLFSGGALLKLSVFALGIMPYITASIIIQLLVVVIPRFEQLKKEGQSGQQKLTQYSRYLTIGLAILQSTGFIALARSGQLFHGCDDCRSSTARTSSPWRRWSSCMTAGTARHHVARRADHRPRRRQRHERADVHLDRGPHPERGPDDPRQNTGAFVFTLILLLGLAIIVAVVFVEQAQRRIPVQYAKRMIGRRQYGGTSTYLPLKVNQAGVIPVIFASSLLYIPQLISQLQRQQQRPASQRWVNNYLINQQSWVYIAIYFAADHLLHLLLRRHHLQPGRARRRHEEVRRVHPRHPAGPPDGRVPAVRAVPDHAARRRCTWASSPSCRTSSSRSPAATTRTSRSAAPQC